MALGCWDRWTFLYGMGVLKWLLAVASAVDLLCRPGGGSHARPDHGGAPGYGAEHARPGRAAAGWWPADSRPPGRGATSTLECVLSLIVVSQPAGEGVSTMTQVQA